MFGANLREPSKGLIIKLMIYILLYAWLGKHKLPGHTKTTTIHTTRWAEKKGELDLLYINI